MEYEYYWSKNTTAPGTLCDIICFETQLYGKQSGLHQVSDLCAPCTEETYGTVFSLRSF